MQRADLERLDRDTLISRAEAAGVSRARILTRPELIDELILRSSTTDAATTTRARGLFGIARDLVARVVERGLHLPDAADRIRGVPVAPPHRSAAAALPTVTLAEIYAAQGHRERAVETLRRVIDREPEHAAARTLLTQLEDGAFAVPKPALPPEPEEEDLANAPEDAEEPRLAADDAGDAAKEAPEAHKEPDGMLDDAPLPERYDVDECVAIPVEPTAAFIYWEVRQDTLERLQATRPGGSIALRIVIIVPTWDGPRSTVRDHDVDVMLGDWFARELPAGCVVRAAIGWRVDGAFVPFSHSPALETPRDAASPAAANLLVRWTPTGATLVKPGDPDASSIARALDALDAVSAAEAMGGQGEQGAGGLTPRRHATARRTRAGGSSEGWSRLSS